MSGDPKIIQLRETKAQGRYGGGEVDQSAT